jgi:hypothetical protein
MVFPQTRLAVTVVYCVLTVVVLLATRHQVARAFRWLRA